MPGALARRPFRSLARLSWPGHALLVCGAFLLVGVAVWTTYGAGPDAPMQRHIADRNLAYITGDADRLGGFKIKHNRYYGVAFELPLLLFERGLGLEDSHRISLLRHLVTHGFFLVGGLCCALLVYRLTRSRGVALFALLLFVLQPRLYAHSFFNGKDLPFLSMFMVTLYVTHRAFRRDTVGAFVLCGVCVGVLTNLRIMGVLLFPAVLALRGLDLLQAGRGARSHVLVTGGVFALAGPGMLYALSPYLWADPLEFGTAVQTLAHYRHDAFGLFQGRLVFSHHLPPHYVPTWVAISTPLVTLLGGGLGVLRVCSRSVRRPRAALGNTDLRFGLLLLACLTLPVLAIIALGSHLYDGWRHVFFLHAPLCGLAGLGVHWAGGRSRQAAAGVYTLAGMGVLVTGVEMVHLHPHQHVYFNRLVDRTTPEYLRDHYVLGVWGISCGAGLEFLRRRYPTTMVYVRNSWPVYLKWQALPRADRGWVALASDDEAADFRIRCGGDLQMGGEALRNKTSRQRWLDRQTRRLEHALYVGKVYNNTLLTVTAQVTVPERNRRVAHRAENTYRQVSAGRLVAQGPFDVYTYSGGRMLGYAREGCTLADTRPGFFLHVYPMDARELPAPRRQYGFDNLDFRFADWGKQVAGQCWTTVALPTYAIARLRTGQYTERGEVWETELAGPLP